MVVFGMDILTAINHYYQLQIEIFGKIKLGKNILRDKQNISDLMAKGWRVIIVWQCEIKNKKMRESRLNSLIDDILSRWHTFTCKNYL